MKTPKSIILPLLLLVVLSAQSQSEVVVDTFKANLPPTDTKPAINTDFGFRNNLYPATFSIENPAKYNFENASSNVFNIPKYDYLLESHIIHTTPNPLAVRNPFAADFIYGNILSLSPNSFISGFQTRQTYMLIGTLERVGGNYTYFTDKLRVSAGISVDKYREAAQSKYDAGINAQISYSLHDNATLTLFGMHSFNPDKDMFSRGMYRGRPQTYYGGNIQFRMLDMLDVKTGFYGANYQTGMKHGNDFGINIDAGLWVSDKLKIAALGQYSLHNNRGEMSGGMGMYPQSHYGGYIEFKVNENWGVRGGALRQFDIRKGKWITVPYFEIISYK